jgi:hypothetical protein
VPVVPASQEADAERSLELVIRSQSGKCEDILSLKKKKKTNNVTSTESCINNYDYHLQHLQPVEIVFFVGHKVAKEIFREVSS